MKKLYCIICGEEGSRTHNICYKCMEKGKAPQSTVKAIKEIDSAIEILDISAITDSNIGEVIRKLNKAKSAIEETE